MQHRPDAQLLIVGDGPARETLERQVVKMGLSDHVQFTG
nr:glycosyltransferase [Limosilactobacillus mucosae]